jgi:hypothetical protein
MAKKRKGAKRGSSASRSRPSKAVLPKKRSKPVAPAPSKSVRTFKEKSRAALRGWETRRRENPLRWGSKAIAKKRENLQKLQSSSSTIEREWAEIERKAQAQAAEAALAGGEHPAIAAKLAPLRRIRAEMDKMETMIRTFNSPTPDPWELTAYHMLERFVTLRDHGAVSEDTIGPNGETIIGLKTAHREWYEAKQLARQYSRDWPAWMAMIGSVLGLPMHGNFSVDSFVTS